GGAGERVAGVAVAGRGAHAVTEQTRHAGIRERLLRRDRLIHLARHQQHGIVTAGAVTARPETRFPSQPAGRRPGTRIIAGRGRALEYDSRTASVWQPAQALTSFSAATSTGLSPSTRACEGKNGPLSRGSVAVNTGVDAGAGCSWRGVLAATGCAGFGAGARR